MCILGVKFSVEFRGLFQVWMLCFFTPEGAKPHRFHEFIKHHLKTIGLFLSRSHWRGLLQIPFPLSVKSFPPTSSPDLFRASSCLFVLVPAFQLIQLLSLPSAYPPSSVHFWRAGLSLPSLHVIRLNKPCSFSLLS